MKGYEQTQTIDNRDIMNSALKSIGDGVIITDVLGRITFMNKKAESLTKYNIEDSINRLMSEIFVIYNMKNDEIETNILSKAIVTGETTGLSSDHMLINNIDEKLFISANIAPILDKEGLVSGSVTIFRDITRIRNTENELRKYSEVFKQSPSSIVITDLKWNVEYINHFLPNLEDRSSLDVQGENINNITMGIMIIDYKEVEVVIERTGQWEKEISYLNENNEIRDIAVTINGIYDENIEISNYVINKEDITTRKEVERLLSVERENFASIFYVSPLGLITVGEDSLITRINDEACNIFKKNKKDMIGKKFCESISCYRHCEGDYETSEKAYSCIIKNSINKALKFNKTIKGAEFKHSLEEKNGKVLEIWLRLSVVPVVVNESKFAMVVFEDITSNKIMANTLIENESRLRLITDNMNDLVIQVNSEGSIRYVSPSIYNLLGFTPEYAMNKSIFDYVHPEDVEKSYDAFRRRLLTNSNFITELRMKTKEHGYYWFEVSGNIFKDNDGKPYIVYVCRDVTEKREVVNQIKLAKEEAVAANNAKSEFLANMSHEIRTPMNGIIGMTNLTLMTELTEEQQENLVMVKNSAQSLLKIINEILDFSKIEAGKISMNIVDFEPALLMCNLVKNFRNSAHEKKLDINVYTDHELPNLLRGDSNKIRQVMNNLISNSIKFTESGEINLSAVIVGRSENAVDVEFTVSDTGVGIEESAFNKIFSSFSQADGSITRTYGGTGLGLSISKQLVELMRGKISFSSKKDRGSKFSFVVPLKYSRIEKVENKDIKMEIPKAKMKSEILLVEDDRINQLLARTLLEKQGHKVTLANNGREALDLLEDSLFDLILMDIQMPEMGGVEATSIIRKNSKIKHIPIIALTAHAIKGDQERFLGLGMDDYISKPIDTSLLFNMLDRYLDKGYGSNNDIQSEVEKLIRGTKNIERDHSGELNPDEHKLFINDLEDYASELEEYISKKDYFNIERTSHFMKSIAGAGNFMKIRKIAFKIEMLSRKENVDQIKKIFEKLLLALEDNKA